MPAAGGKGKPKNPAELSDDTKVLREEKQVPFIDWLVLSVNLCIITSMEQEFSKPCILMHLQLQGDLGV